MSTAPFERSVIQRYPDRAAWDAEAADIVARMLDRWHLTVRDALTGGEAGATLLVDQSDGTPAVLKVGYPHLEALWEAVALEAWAPIAPAVLRQDAWTWALLLERVFPGTPLSRAELEPVEAVAIGARRYAELSAVQPPEGIPTLVDSIGHFAPVAAEQLPGWRAMLDRLGSRALVERAIEELPELGATADRQVFLHGDYNPGNLLASDDGSWRVVDPKPLVGDPAFDPWPLVEQLGAPWQQRQPGDTLLRNATVACDLIGIERERLLRWAFARTGLNVTWYLEDRDLQHAAEEVAKLEVVDRMLVSGS
jgi:streptomycin 6-kinase